MEEFVIKKIKEYPNVQIGVFCEHAKEVEEDVRNILGPQKISNVIFFESNPKSFRGYKFKILLIQSGSAFFDEKQWGCLKKSGPIIFFS